MTLALVFYFHYRNQGVIMDNTTGTENAAATARSREDRPAAERLDMDRQSGSSSAGQTRSQPQTELSGAQNSGQTSSGDQTIFEPMRQRSDDEPQDPAYATELKYRSAGSALTSKVARGLGYFSIALGLGEVLMPRQMGELIGVNQKYRSVLPWLGLREIASGLTILNQQKPTAGVWSRVVGDGIDLAYLGSAFADKTNNKNRLLGATIAVLGVTAADAICAQALSGQKWGSGKNPTAPTTVGQPSARQKMDDAMIR